MVRLPRYAGRHYFADPGRLRASIESLVEDAAAVSVAGTLRAIIVPHGTLREFGPIAGHGYKLLLSVRLTSELTVLLAPAAATPNDSGAVLCDPSDAYATPLDLIGISASAVDSLGRVGISVLRWPDEEPVIENHLPFIQVVMGDTQFLPLRIPSGVDLDAPGWDEIISRLGLIIAAANLPHAHEQASCDAITRLDERFFAGRALPSRAWGLLGLLGRKSSEPVKLFADAAVIALAIRMARAKGADRGQLLARDGCLAAFALYCARGPGA